jgi:hypothetical protein
LRATRRQQLVVVPVQQPLVERKAAAVAVPDLLRESLIAQA